MSKDSVAEWDATAANNTDVAGVNIAEGAPAAGMNDALRAIMAQVKAWSTPDPVRVSGDQTVNGAKTFTGNLTVSNAAPALFLEDTNNSNRRLRVLFNTSATFLQETESDGATVVADLVSFASGGAATFPVNPTISNAAPALFLRDTTTGNRARVLYDAGRLFVQETQADGATVIKDLGYFDGALVTPLGAQSVLVLGQADALYPRKSDAGQIVGGFVMAAAGGASSGSGVCTGAGFSATRDTLGGYTVTLNGPPAVYHPIITPLFGNGAVAYLSSVSGGTFQYTTLDRSQNAIDVISRISIVRLA